MLSPIKTSATADKLVIAAAQLFARQGYHGTSTREIARLAGVSENTLFRHFESKEDLFWAALLWHARGFSFRHDLLEGMGRCDSPEVVFPRLFELMADTANFRPELLRLIAVAFLELHWKAEAFCLEYLSPMLTSINQYLALNMKRGKIRDLDPTLLTGAFMVSALMYPSLSRLLGGDNLTRANSRDPARSYTRFWLDVLTPMLPAHPQEALLKPQDSPSQRGAGKPLSGNR